MERMRAVVMVSIRAQAKESGASSMRSGAEGAVGAVGGRVECMRALVMLSIRGGHVECIRAAVMDSIKEGSVWSACWMR